MSAFTMLKEDERSNPDRPFGSALGYTSKPAQVGQVSSGLKIEGSVVVL